MKSIFLLSIFVCSALSLFADVLPYTSAGGTSVGGGLSYQYSIDNYLGNNGIYFMGVTSGTTSVQVPFAITLSLPSASDYGLSSASLSFSGSVTNGASSGYNGYGSQGYYGSYVCGYYYGPIYCPENNYVPAQASFYGDSFAELTGVSDGGLSVNVFAGSGSTLDLLGLGFGNDLLNGGTLTLTGYRQIQSGLNGISASGFNANTNFFVNVDAGGNQFATLNIGGDQVESAQATPEPRWGILLLGGLGMAMIYKFRAKRIEA
jgi:hypothetical protein